MLEDIIYLFWDINYLFWRKEY